ncbi:GNAT family N-acetyltransferase [Pilimelia columellifera]|uniref:GNAT family protein n=1 Tax=Pilimelia columellifera subsp. columellifera TaxID=706583 RepID=A0ABN3NAN6_9ACTN
MRPDLPIRTERLLLRPYRDTDIDDLHAWQSRADVTRYVPFAPRDRRAVAAQIRRKLTATQLAADGDTLELAVTLPDGAYVGEVLLFYRSAEHRGFELGYIVHPDHTGNGYGTEAARAVLRLAFESFDAHRVYARLDARNDPSARLLERLGMRREAHLVSDEFVKGEWTDTLVYAMLENEWAAGATAPPVNERSRPSDRE